MKNSEQGAAACRQQGLEDRATFIPGYQTDELPELLGRTDVYVSSSLSDGTSISLLEAMATGTFPVVSDIPANRPWVEHGRNGLLFPPGDDAALANCLAEALEDAQRRAEAALICRQIVLDRGDLRKGADLLLEVFQQATEE